MMENTALLSALLGLAVAQVLKPGLRVLLNGEPFNYRLLMGSGGMPSSHSATVFALAASLGVERGLSSDVFAIAVIVAVIVAYDARGVRQEAGRHAAMLNAMGAAAAAAQSTARQYAPDEDLESGLVSRRPSLPREQDTPGTGTNAAGSSAPEVKELKENIGHTSAEVVGGALVGTLVGVLVAVVNSGA